MGKQDYALLRMYTRYKTMIPCRFTTLWEHYDRWWASHIDAFDDASSLNHGWNPPVILLSQTIAGVCAGSARLGYLSRSAKGGIPDRHQSRRAFR